MAYKIIEADLGKDKEEILSVWKRNSLPVSELRYDWIYRNNPGGGVFCWLIQRENRGVVGATGLLSRRMKIGPRVVRVGQAIDLVVDKNHRTAGPVLKLQKTLLASTAGNGLGFVYSFPNQKSEAVLVRGGYQVLGNFTRWVKPLSFRYKLEDYLGKSRIARGLTLLIDGAMGVLFKEVKFKKSPRAEVEIIEKFDPRFDALWEKASRGFYAVGERSSAYLDWRFRNCPDENYRTFCLLKTPDEISGYVVFSEHDGFVNISDFFVEEPEILDRLLPEFISFLRAHLYKSVSLNFLGPDRYAEKFRRVGFYLRPGSSRVLVHLGEGSPSAGSGLLDKNNWFLTQGDRDV